MMQHKKISPQQFGWVCAFVAASTPLTTSFSVLANAQAQSPDGAKNAKIRIHSSNSMVGLNKSVKQQFEGKYSGSSVSVNTMPAQKAIDDVANNTAEVAAIGRALTPAEKAKGLMEVLVGRDKIAVVVSPNNAFNKDLTIPKFAKMFRGEISNWSELGGRKESISFVDRVNSDTRQALAGYPQFKAAAFESGKNAVKLQDTSMKALTETLKASGVSFVPANQAKTQAGLRTLSMDGVLPTDARYPFSQPLYYVYNTNVAGGMRSDVKALLGFVSSNEGQAAVKAAGIVPAVKGETIAAAPEKAGAKAEILKAGGGKVAGTGTTVRPNGSPSGIEGKTGEKIAISNNAIAAEQDGNLFGLPFPSWLRWLLPLGLLGMGLLLLLMPNKNDRGDLQFEEGEGSSSGNPLSGAGTTLGNAGRNPTELIGNSTHLGVGAIGGAAAIGGLAAGSAGRRGDTQDWNDSDGAPYIKDDTDFSSVDQARTAIGNAATNTTQAVGDFAGAGGAAGVGVAAAGAGTAAWGFLTGKGQAETEPDSRATDLKATDLKATDLKATDLRAQTSDPTINVPSNESADFSVAGQEWDFGNTADSLSTRANETATGIGGTTSNFFDRLKDSASNLKGDVNQAGANAGAAAMGAAAMSAAALGGTAASARTRLVGDRAGIVLVPQTAREAVVRWQLTEAQKIDARSQGGIDLALRLYDVTGINPDRDALENFYQYDCSELTQELRIEVPVPARDYVVEVGYLDRAGEWIGVARSLAVNIAS